GLEEGAYQPEGSLSLEECSTSRPAPGENDHAVTEVQRGNLPRLNEPVLLQISGGKDDGGPFGVDLVHHSVGGEVEQSPGKQVSRLEEVLTGGVAGPENAAVAHGANELLALCAGVRQRGELQLVQPAARPPLCPWHPRRGGIGHGQRGVGDERRPLA